MEPALEINVKVIVAPRPIDGTIPVLVNTFTLNRNLAVLCEAGLNAPALKHLEFLRANMPRRGVTRRKLQFRISGELASRVEKKKQELRKLGANGKTRNRILDSVMSIGYSNVYQMPLEKAAYRGVLADRWYRKVARDELIENDPLVQPYMRIIEDNRVAGGVNMAKAQNSSSIFVEAEVIPHAEAVLRFDYSAPPRRPKKVIDEEADLSALRNAIDRIKAKISIPDPA